MRIRRLWERNSRKNKSTESINWLPVLHNFVLQKRKIRIRFVSFERIYCTVQYVSISVAEQEPHGARLFRLAPESNFYNLDFLNLLRLMTITIMSKKSDLKARPRTNATLVRILRSTWICQTGFAKILVVITSDYFGPQCPTQAVFRIRIYFYADPGCMGNPQNTSKKKK